MCSLGSFVQDSPEHSSNKWSRFSSMTSSRMSIFLIQSPCSFIFLWKSLSYSSSCSPASKLVMVD